MRRIRECHDGLFERELTHRVIGTFYDVYNELGYGFLESVYARSMMLELERRGFKVAAQVPAEVRYSGEVVGMFRADLVVESRLVLQLKASKSLGPADEMQVLNYLRATDLELGLLLHFGPRPAFRRLIATRSAPLPDSRSSASSVSSASAAAVRIDPASAPSGGPPRAASAPISPGRASSGPHPHLRSAAYRTP
ncbi:MAG: GxxExxY protein [Gemmatimonadaceae bacterium]|nr:GxxExxY protein [Gemmatimonadaceae bacterium]